MTCLQGRLRVSSTDTGHSRAPWPYFWGVWACPLWIHLCRIYRVVFVVKLQ